MHASTGHFPFERERNITHGEWKSGRGQGVHDRRRAGEQSAPVMGGVLVFFGLRLHDLSSEAAGTISSARLFPP